MIESLRVGCQSIPSKSGIFGLHTISLIRSLSAEEISFNWENPDPREQ